MSKTALQLPRLRLTEEGSLQPYEKGIRADSQIGTQSPLNLQERIEIRVNALKFFRRMIGLLDRFPERNQGYERSRARATEKFWKLESDTEEVKALPAAGMIGIVDVLEDPE